MATKKELIAEIKQLVSDEQILDSLKSMNKTELEQTLDYEIKVRAFNNPADEVDFEFEKEEDLPSPSSDDQTVIDTLPIEEKIDPKLMQEYVEYKKPSELSISEQRLYARTGKLPEKKK